MEVKEEVSLESENEDSEVFWSVKPGSMLGYRTRRHSGWRTGGGTEGQRMQSTRRRFPDPE